MIQDILSGASKSRLLDSATITEDSNGDASCDLQGYEGGALICAIVGASGDTLSSSVKIELEVEESDDNTTFTDVADADLVGYVAGTNDGCFAVIDAADEDDLPYVAQYVGSKRYIRAVVNVTGTHTNGTPIGIAAIKLKNKYAPTA